MTTIELRYAADSYAESLTDEEIDAWLDSLDRAQLEHLLYDWQFWRRESQGTPPEFESGEKTYWLNMAGRGYGKTRTGGEQAIEWAKDPANRRIALVGKDPADARDVMIEGESGILTISAPWFMPTYEPSKRRVTWPNGNKGYVYSGFEPEGLRGPNFHKAWCDEIAAWKYPQRTWDNLMFGLRLGRSPQAMVTTTPRPIPLIKDLIKNPACVVTTGTTYENRANLAAAFYNTIVKKYEGTRLGEQELNARLLEDVPGALWRRSIIDAKRINESELPKLGRTVVGVDPAVTSTDESNETGIIVVSRGIGSLAEHCYVRADRSGRHPATEWPKIVVRTYQQWIADRVVPEKNNGGDLVEAALRVVDPMVPVTPVWASKGKRTRAEPVAALYEQGKVHHVGSFSELEDQMCTFVPDEREDESPDRVDALVWAISDLMFGPQFAQT